MTISEKVIEVAQSQVGYKEESGNKTKYGKFFDTEAWQFFNTKKNGSDWCSQFVHYCIYMVVLAIVITYNRAGEITRKMLGEKSAKDNCGAGVKYLYNYMKAAKLIVKTPKKGDIIFLNNLGHVGLVEDADSKKVYTIEGNAGSPGSVKRRSYALTSSKIYGYGRPKYSLLINEAVTQKPEETILAPVPAGSFNKKYNSQFKVSAEASMINLRPKNQVICKIPKGSVVRCYGFFSGDYLYCVYKSHEGYIYRGLLT